MLAFDEIPQVLFDFVRPLLQPVPCALKLKPAEKGIIPLTPRRIHPIAQIMLQALSADKEFALVVEPALEQRPFSQ